jgi:hypothetical protein
MRILPQLARRRVDAVAAAEAVVEAVVVELLRAAHLLLVALRVVAEVRVDSAAAVVVPVERRRAL